MPDEQERHRIEVDRVDRQVIEEGPRPGCGTGRSGPATRAWTGSMLRSPWRWLLDELARHLRDLPPAVRAQAVRRARMLLGE